MVNTYLKSVILNKHKIISFTSTYRFHNNPDAERYDVNCKVTVHLPISWGAYMRPKVLWSFRGKRTLIQLVKRAEIKENTLEKNGHFSKTLRNRSSIIGFKEKRCPGRRKIRAKTQTEKKKKSACLWSSW